MKDIHSLRKERITVRLYPNQLQVLKELKENLGCSYSLVIRTIIGSWLTENEDTLDRIIIENQRKNVKDS